MDMITVTAKTVDEAVTKALIELETTSDKLEYEVVDKGSTGFLGIGAKPAIIRAKKKSPLRIRPWISCLRFWGNEYAGEYYSCI